jgi:choline-sulfatase
VVAAFAKAGERFTQHLAANPKQPVFAFVHTYEVHDPYMPVPPYRTLFTAPDYAGRIIASYDELSAIVGTEWQSQHDFYWSRVDAGDPRDVRHLQDLYDGSIRLTDDQIGTLVGRLRDAGVADQTLIVVLGDHGEEFLDHGQFQHEQVYQELLHVPLVMVFPGEKGRAFRGRRENAVVRLIDVLPTILDFLGLPVPEHVQGVSLMAGLAGGAAPPREVMSSWREGGWQALRVGDAKLVQQERAGAPVRRELYDLQNDPGERHNRWEADPDTATRLSQRLAELLAESRSFLASRRRGREVVPGQDTVERLRALGSCAPGETSAVGRARWLMRRAARARIGVWCGWRWRSW